MLGLLDQMESENPEDPTLAPKESHCLPSICCANEEGRHICKPPVPVLQTLHEWACAYVKYVAIFKKLERAYDQTIHPQKRIDMKGALEACMGRVLEVKHYLVGPSKQSHS